MRVETWQDPVTQNFVMKCLDCGEVAEVSASQITAGPREMFKPENFSHVCRKKLEAPKP